MAQGRKSFIQFNITVPPKLKRFLNNPDSVASRTLREADKQVLEFLQQGIRKEAGKFRKSGKLERSVTVDIDKRKVYTSRIYARALEMGHYAEPRNTPKDMFLKFAGRGKEVFLRYVRTEAQPYFFKTLEENKTNIMDFYRKQFRNIMEKA